MSSVRNLCGMKALDGFSREGGEVVRRGGVLRGLISTRECLKTGEQKIQFTKSKQFKNHTLSPQISFPLYLYFFLLVAL